MDDLTRAVELTKARILELHSAYLLCLLHTKDAPTTFEGLKAAIVQSSDDFKAQAMEIREQVARNEGPQFPLRN